MQCEKNDVQCCYIEVEKTLSPHQIFSFHCCSLLCFLYFILCAFIFEWYAFSISWPKKGKFKYSFAMQNYTVLVQFYEVREHITTTEIINASHVKVDYYTACIAAFARILVKTISLRGRSHAIFQNTAMLVIQLKTLIFLFKHLWERKIVKVMSRTYHNQGSNIV